MKHFTRNYKRITLITAFTTLCVLIFSITILAAPMKQKKSDADNVDLPGAGMNKVVNDYVEASNETDVKILANEISTAAKDVAKNEKAKTTKKITKAVDTKEKTTKKKTEAETKAIEPETDEMVYEETEIYYEPEEVVYDEVSEYEEPYVEEEVYYDDTWYSEEYSEPVYEEEYNEEPQYNEYTEEYVYDDNAGEAEVISEPVYEEDYQETYEVVEEPAYEVVEEETTLAEFLEEQDQRLAEEQAAKDSSALGQTIANDACQYVGILPYVWAGSSLETGADCSGFTMAIYAKYGYYLSHDSNVQSCEGRSVPLSEAQPGDIIVYSGHVGMYIGNGQVVHAPHTGRMVSIDSVNMMTVLDVRRIID